MSRSNIMRFERKHLKKTFKTTGLEAINKHDVPDFR